MSAHECPGPECHEMVPLEMLACSRHWYQVPRPVRAAVWRTWAGGTGAGTPAHAAALRKAVAAMRPL